MKNLASNIITPKFIPKKIIVNDSMQHNYEYFLTEPIGENFDPLFRPELTPSQMLKMGVFGGVYLRDGKHEFPLEWFEGARLQKSGTFCPDPNLNFFGTLASQPLRVWREKGWINPQDPRGWFQWYCRYYMGRRSEDDLRQIKRHRTFARHVAQVKKYCTRGDFYCRARQKQALLQWAYDSSKM